MILKEVVAELKKQARDATALQDGLYWLAHCIGKKNTLTQYGALEAPITAEQLTQFWEGWRAYVGGKPLAYLVGTAAFWDFELKVTPSVLIPRPDTETLVRAALALSLPSDAAVLEWGTGSGAIALALKKERPSWQVMALDLSPEALRVAQQNADALQLAVHFVQSQGFHNIPSTAQFEMIISNPPYVTALEWAAHPSLAFEPYVALVAPEEGLADLKDIIEQGIRYLKSGGYLLLEHGATQGQAVAALFAEAGYQQIVHHKDYAGHVRVTAAQKP